MKIEKPKNQNAEVLYLLINNKCINRQSIMYDTGILNVTARIANLRNIHQIAIDCKRVSVLNKFGRSVNFGVWSISKKPSDLKLIEKKYNKINK